MSTFDAINYWGISGTSAVISLFRSVISLRMIAASYNFSQTLIPFSAVEP